MKKKFGVIDNIVILGGSWLSAKFLEELAEQKISTMLYTSPRHYYDVINDTGTKLCQLIETLKIPVEVVDDINKAESLSHKITKTSLGLAIGAAWNFNKETVKLFDGKLLDFMGIPLPTFRGGAHYTWQILSKNKIGACNLQVIYGGKKTFHRGEIIKSYSYRFSDSAKIPLDYFQEALTKEIEFLNEFVLEVRNLKEFSLKPLDEKFSSYFPFLNTKKQAWVNWNWTAEDISTFICAFDEPYAGTSTYLNGRRVFLKSCELLNKEENFHPFQSGLIYRSTSSGVFVAAKDGTLAINKILNQNGDNITKTAIEGSRFFTPQSEIENSLLFEAEYVAKGLKT